MFKTWLKEMSALTVVGFGLLYLDYARVAPAVQTPIHIQVADFPRPVSAAVLQIESNLVGP